MGSNETGKPGGETGKKPVKVFFSYSESEKDEKLLKEVYKHLQFKSETN